MTATCLNARQVFFKLGLGRSIRSLIILTPKLLLVSVRYFTFTSSSTLSSCDQRTDTSSHLAFHFSLLSCLLLCCDAAPSPDSAAPPRAAVETWSADNDRWTQQRESSGQFGVILLQPTKILLFLFFTEVHQMFLKVKNVCSIYYLRLYLLTFGSIPNSLAGNVTSTKRNINTSSLAEC